MVSTTLPHSSNLDPVFDLESNVIRSVKLLDMAVKHQVKKIIFTSSGGTVYGKPTQVPIAESHPTEPTCSYGISKLAIEKYLALYKQLHGLDYTVLRIANPFGERQRLDGQQGAIAVFMGKVLRSETVEIWGDGSVVRDYIHISDVVRALLLAMSNTSIAHGVFNIGSGQGYSLNEVLSAIEQVTRKKVLRRFLVGRTFDVPVSVLDIAYAGTHLGWQPQTTFLQGLKQFYAWIDNSSDKIK
jgi:UDP-glucose 4-epimerase